MAPAVDCSPPPEELEGFPGSSDLTTSTPPKLPTNYPCGASRYKTCPTLRATDEFSSHTTGQTYKVKFRTSCKSSNVVYLITCRRYGLQYVGETSQLLHVRVNGHRFDFAHLRTEVSPVAEHFNSGAHTESDVMIMVINLPPRGDSCL